VRLHVHSGQSNQKGVMRSVNTLRSCFVCLLLVGAAHSSLAEAADAPDSLEARVTSFIMYPPIDAVPYAEIEAFGPAALPTLRKLLDNPEYEKFHSQVLTMLGNLGDASDTPRLNKYIIGRYSGEIDDQRLTNVFAALMALGCLSDRDPAALGLLRRYANPKSFAQVPFTSAGRSEEYLRLLLSKIAINGIGLSGRPEAEALLTELKRRPYDKAQIPNVDDAIPRHRAIVKVGRAHYSRELTRQAQENGGRK